MDIINIMDIIEIIQFPFIQRALIGGLIVGFLLAFIGVFVVLRKMSFFGDGIAHASLAGIAIGLLTAYNPLIVAILFAILFAILIYYLEKHTTLSPDSIIGILFPSSMAIGVILMSIRGGYQPDLISFLFGNILAIRSSELFIMSALGFLVVLFLIYFFRQITFLSLDKEGAKVAGIKTGFLDIIFYISLAVIVVLGVKILGIILVSALLVIPSATSKLIVRSFKGLVVMSIIVAEITVVGGLFFSYLFNFPTGAVIIIFGSLIFSLTLLGKKLIWR